jgi:hypothetical protein
MTNLAAYAQKFFIFGGFLLIAIAVIQALSRPRQRGEGRVPLRFEAAIVRMILFLTVGVLAVLVGFGVISMTGPR